MHAAIFASRHVVWLSGLSECEQDPILTVIDLQYVCGSLRVLEVIRDTQVRREKRVTKVCLVLQDCLGGQDLW